MASMYNIFVKQIGRLLESNAFKIGSMRNCAPLSNVGGLATQKPVLDLEMDRIVWIDMEMTGLDADRDKIMEIACLITDSQLNVVAESPDIIIHQPKDILDGMNEWCIKQHGKTGLTEACLQSQTSLKEAESTILNFLMRHVAPQTSPLAGNSVYMDRYFLIKHMPKVHEYLHYRIIDVSTVKEICKRWNVNVYKSLPQKEFEHRALNDIKESVEELKHYKQHFLKLGEQN